MPEVVTTPIGFATFSMLVALAVGIIAHLCNRDPDPDRKQSRAVFVSILVVTLPFGGIALYGYATVEPNEVLVRELARFLVHVAVGAAWVSTIVLAVLGAVSWRNFPRARAPYVGRSQHHGLS